MTPKLMIKLVPLPFSLEGKSSGMYTPSTIMIAVSMSRMHPSTTVCTNESWVAMRKKSNPMSERMRHLRASFLFIDWRSLVNKRFANT